MSESVRDLPGECAPSVAQMPSIVDKLQAICKEADHRRYIGRSDYQILAVVGENGDQFGVLVSNPRLNQQSREDSFQVQTVVYLDPEGRYAGLNDGEFHYRFCELVYGDLRFYSAVYVTGLDPRMAVLKSVFKSSLSKTDRVHGRLTESEIGSLCLTTPQLPRSIDVPETLLRLVDGRGPNGAALTENALLRQPLVPYRTDGQK